MSPALHEREADHLGLRYLYQLVDLDHLAVDADVVRSVLAGARRLGFRGLNVTHPCKQAVIPHLDYHQIARRHSIWSDHRCGLGTRGDGDVPLLAVLQPVQDRVANQLV